MEDLTVRPWVETDREPVTELIAELQDYERFIHPSRLPGPDIATDHLRRLIDWVERSSGAIMVAELRDTGEVIGYSCGWLAIDNDPLQEPDYRRHGYVADVYVTERFRAKGVAARLLEAIETHLVQSGARRLRIAALARNRNAIVTFREFGFEPYEVVLEKDLDARAREALYG